MSRRNKRHRIAAPASLWRRVPWRVVRAVAVFAVLSGIWFYCMQIAVLREHLWDPFTGLVARVTGWIFTLFGAEVQASGMSIDVNGTVLGIAFGCNGLEAHGIFIAAVLASAMSWRRKLSGLMLGFIVVFLINQIRVCGLFVAAWTSQDLFEYGHTIVGQTFVIVFTMALFLWWDSRDEPEKKRKPHTVSS